MTDQTVEVVGRRRPGVALDVPYRRVLHRRVGERRCHAVRFLERRAVGHVDHDLELALVVEGQHLHVHQLQRDQRDAAEEQHDDAHEKHPAQPRVHEERPHRAPIERGQAIFTVVTVCGRRPQDPHGGPGRDDERDDEREHHRGRRTHGNRAHVGAHQAADKCHGQDRGDDGKRRQDRRVSDLVDGTDRHCHHAAVRIDRQPCVAHDVFYDDNRIVHEDADGEDQREERDPVQRVAVEIEGEERERQSHRYGQQHDRGFALAERQPDQRRDGQHGQQHVPQQLVRLLGGCLAVIPSHRHLEIGWHRRASHELEFLLDAPCDVDGVGALALGDRERDGWIRPAPLVERDVAGRPGVTVDHRRDVAEENRALAMRAHDDAAQIVCGFDPQSRPQRRGRSAFDLAPGGDAHVGRSDCLLHE